VLPPGSGRAGILSRLISRLQADQEFRRRAFLRGAWGTIGGITVISVVLGILAFTLAPDLADGIALAGDVMVAATLLLAVLAAAVAVLAYTVSTGAPDLRIRVKFPFSAANAPMFEARKDEFDNLQAVNFKQLTGEIYLGNRNQYSARNPTVTVRLKGMAFNTVNIPDGWAMTGFGNTIGATEVQWDGGAAYSVHGDSSRRLPDLRLGGLTTIPAVTPHFEIELLADGYRRTLTIPVGFKIDARVVIPGGSRQEAGEWL
jgi:hypothetical protein